MSIYTALSRIGLKKPAVRLAYFVHDRTGSDTHRAIADKFLLEGTDFLTCEYCECPTLSTDDPTHELCRDALSPYLGLAEDLLTVDRFRLAVVDLRTTEMAH
jgi:hypothetical protein